MTTIRAAFPSVVGMLLLGAASRAQDGEDRPQQPDPRIAATVDGAWPNPDAPFKARTRRVAEKLRGFAGEPLRPTDGERLIAPHEDGRFPTLPAYAALRVSLLRSIGGPGTDRAPEYRVEVLRSSAEDEVLLAASDVLRRFANAELEVRAPLAEILARRLVGFESRAHQRPADPARHRDLAAENARQTLRSLDGISRHTLHELTGARLGNGQTWWGQRSWERCQEN